MPSWIEEKNYRLVSAWQRDLSLRRRLRPIGAGATPGDAGRLGAGGALTAESEPKSTATQVVQDGERRFRITGELDMSTASLLESAMKLSLNGEGDIVLDISGVRFMDSTGLKILIGACDSLGSKGRLILWSPSDAVSRLLALTQMDLLKNLHVDRGPRLPEGPLSTVPGAQTKAG